MWRNNPTEPSVLGRIGKPAIPAMIITLHDKDPALRTFAVRALAEMQDEAVEAVPALIAALNDPSIQVEVVDALARIGQAAAPAIPA